MFSKNWLCVFRRGNFNYQLANKRKCAEWVSNSEADISSAKYNTLRLNLLSQQSKMHVNSPLAKLAKQQIAGTLSRTWEWGRNFAAAGMKLNQVFSFLVARSQHSNLLIKFNLRYCYAKQIKEGSFARGTCNRAEVDGVEICCRNAALH